MSRLLNRFSKQQLPLRVFLSKEPFSELAAYAQTPRPEWKVLGEVVNARLHEAPVEELAPLLKIFAYQAVHSLDWKKMMIAAEWDVSKASPRAVVALALCFARVHSRVEERPRDLYVALGKRVLDLEECAEKWEARDLAHLAFAFGKVKIYHHRLFKFLEQALINKQHELKAEEAVQATYGFARSLPSDFHEMSPSKQERNGFPTLLAAMRLQWLRRMGKEKACNHPTAILLLNTMAMLRWRDDVTLEQIMPAVDVHKASDQDLVYLCVALGKLDAWRFIDDDVVLTALEQLSKKEVQTAASSMSCSALMYPCALMGYSTRRLWADVAAKHCLKDKKAQPWTTAWHYYIYFHFFPFSAFPLPPEGELHSAVGTSPSELHTHVASTISRSLAVKHEVSVGPFVLDMVIDNH